MTTIEGYERFKESLRKAREKIPLEFGNYPYVCARVKAKKSLLIPKEVYRRMLKMGIDQISRFLGEGEYRREILDLGTKYSGVDLIEIATRNNLAKIYTQIINFCEGKLKAMVSRYADKWDVWNVKTILRGKVYGAPNEEILEAIIPAGSFSTQFLKQLIEMEEIREIIDALEGTLYYGPLKPVAMEEKIKSLAPYEDALSHVYYRDLLRTIPPTTEPNRLFRLFIRTEVDVLNLKNLLRVRREEKEIMRDVFIEGGLEISKKELEAMVSMSPEEILQRLKKTPYYEVLAADLPSLDDRALLEVSRNLEKLALTQATKYSHLYPLSILPVLDYMVAKENEVDNIRIIARGKESGLSEETIWGMLVI